MISPKTPRKMHKSRDAQTGQFDQAGPFSDPSIADYAVRVVRAVDDLAPLLAVFAKSHDEDAVRVGSAVAGAFLAVLRDVMLRELAADPDSLRDAKKKRLDAKRLGNMSLVEVQRIQGLAREWMDRPSVAVLTPPVQQFVASCLVRKGGA